jgi:hypothetical protein
MISKSKFSVSENSLNNISLTALKSLFSVGLITIQNKQISFRHQALFDYQVGVRLFNAAQISFGKLQEEIGDFSQQTLTRREHLKYAMNMLLIESQKSFCNTVLSLLQSDKIRFHLKYLLFNSLKEIKQIKSPAKKLIDQVVKSPELLPHFLSSTCYSNPELVKYLAESGWISDWLNIADNEDFILKVIRILGSIADVGPSVVLETLQPYIGKSKVWDNKVYDALCWDMENDSDEMFEIRKQLLATGVNARFIHWKTIAVKKPMRALDLLEMLLEHYKEVLGSSKYFSRVEIDAIANRDTFTESDIKGIEKLANHIPQEALTRLLAKIDSIVSDIEDEKTHETWLHKDKLSNYNAVESITHCVFSVIDRAADELQNQPEVLDEILTPYFASTSPVINHILARLLLRYPTSKADLVISWLLDLPHKRLNCGNTYIEPEWKLPGQLLVKFSPYCSADLLQKLEANVYYSPFDKGVDYYKRILEYRRNGIFYSYCGELQYFLLPTLDPTRISDKSKQLISVLNRKFANYTDKDFCSAYHLRHSGGMVTSPLPLGNVLSDATWSKLILAQNDRTNRKTWRQAGKETIHESSIEQFARSLDIAVTNQPIRFAQLALTLPKVIAKDYIEWLYYGLANTNKNKVHEKYRDEWKLCPVQLIENVINHFGHEGYEYQVVRIFEKHGADDKWSDEAINLLVKISKSAKDPKPEELNILVNGETKKVELASVNSLANNAINCCRGVAYSAIGNLYWKSEDLIDKHLSSLDDVINDPHPAVNYSSSHLLLPLFNYNRELAHEKFLALCNKDLRMSCIDGNHYFFNDGFAESCNFAEQYTGLVLQMKSSEFDEVKKEAGRQMTARWFFYGLFDEEISAVAQWELPLKSGAASVMSQFLTEARYNAYIKKLLPLYEALANDEDKQLLEKIGRSVSNKNYWTRLDADAFFSVLANSRAALYSLWQIFHYLDESKISLVGIASDLLQLVKNVVNSADADKAQRTMNIRDSELIKVLQRLYEEAADDEDDDAINQCLDIWDYLLSAQIYSAIDATAKLDNGMLH